MRLNVVFSGCSSCTDFFLCVYAQDGRVMENMLPFPNSL